MPASYLIVPSVDELKNLMPGRKGSALHNIGRLLKPSGVAILTTPNVDSAPARVKFLLTGTIRMMDVNSEPTHITPIFWDLLTRQFLSRADVQLVERRAYPSRGYNMTRPGLAQIMRTMSLLMKGSCLEGDNHILTLQGCERSSSATSSNRVVQAARVA
jgi:hypothetical protein